jgi:hypothetical protein
MINPLAPARAVGATRKSNKAKRQGDTFARSLADESNAPPVAAVGEHASVVGAIGILLNIQELSTDPEGRGRSKAHGEQLLDLLDEVRHGLLDGRIPIARLETLVTLVKAARLTPSDSKLAETLEEIELLARVEAAKLGYDV